MTREESTGVTFNDLDPSGSWISRSSEFFVVNSAEITLNNTAQRADKTTDKIIVYARYTESG